MVPQPTNPIPTRELDRRTFLAATGSLATTVGYAGPTSANTTRQNQDTTRQTWANVRGNENNTGTISHAGPTTLNIGWTTSFDTQITGRPVCYDEVVYLPLEADIVALSATDGTEQWRHGLPGESDFGLVATDEHVIDGGLIDRGEVHSLDRLTGETVWTRSLRYGVSAPPTAANGCIYIGDGGGVVYAIDETDGTIQWTDESENPIRGAPPSVANGTVFVQSRQGIVRALDERTGERLWTADLTFNNSPIPVARDGLVIIGGYLNEGSNLFALDAASGAQRWKRSLQGSMIRPPAVTANRVFVQTERYVHALNRADGTTRWQTASDGLGGIAAATNAVYAMSARSIRVLEPSTGEELAKNDGHTGHRHFPALSPNRLVVATDDSTVRALGPYETDHLERNVGIAAGGVGFAGVGYLGYRCLRDRRSSGK